MVSLNSKSKDFHQVVGFVGRLAPRHYMSVLVGALAEDLGTTGDLTSRLTIADRLETEAHFVARENGAVAGLEAALATFTLLDGNTQTTAHIQDGRYVRKGERLATVRGTARTILSGERVALNLLGRLCGIATTTYKMVTLIAGTGTILLDTRKTTPTLRALEKHAVCCGGGQNHRFGLYDAIMIKDNHIAIAGGLEQAVRAVQKAHETTKVEVEVDTLEQLAELLKLNKKLKAVDVVLLDNMPPETLKKAVAMIKAAGSTLLTEASGGISPETIRAVAETGVNYISAGFITHSAPNFDIGLDIL